MVSVLFAAPHCGRMIIARTWSGSGMDRNEPSRQKPSGRTDSASIPPV
ncbi:hypothetical protein ACL02S_09585 [Nocardia sp. 004]